MTDSIQYFPAAIFRDKEANCEIQTFITTQAAATNATWVAAVAGKRHRVVSMLAASDAAAVLILNPYTNTTATQIGRLYIPGGTGGAMLKLEFNPAGWFETATGELLGGSTGAGAQAVITIRYITYTP